MVEEAAKGYRELREIFERGNWCAGALEGD